MVVRRFVALLAALVTISGVAQAQEKVQFLSFFDNGAGKSPTS